MSKQHVEASKFLSYVLRHEPQAIGLTLDREGWADIDSLITCAQQSGRSLDVALIRDIVDSNDKKRFAFSEDGRRIRAVQGHSTDTVALQHEPCSRRSFFITVRPHVFWIRSWPAAFVRANVTMSTCRQIFRPQPRLGSATARR